MTFAIAIRPEPKRRPRFSRFGTYTDAKTVKFENHVAIACHNAAKMFAWVKNKSPVAVSLEFDFKRPKTSKLGYPIPDVDNLAKSILDGMNGVLFEDDKQVIRLEAEKRFSDEDRIVVCISKLFT